MLSVDWSGPAPGPLESSMHETLEKARTGERADGGNMFLSSLEVCARALERCAGVQLGQSG